MPGNPTPTSLNVSLQLQLPIYKNDPSLESTYSILNPPPNIYRNIHVKVLSHCLINLSTEIYAENSTSWVLNSPAAVENDSQAQSAENNSKQVVYSKALSLISKSMEEFNENPTVYAVVLGVLNDETKIITFASCDCSSFLLEAGSIRMRSQTVDGIQLHLTISASEILYPFDSVIEQEPVVLKIPKLTNFPCFNQSELDAVYIINKIEFGNFKRLLLSFPIQTEDITVAKSSVYTCILSGALDLMKFKEYLSSQCFVVEIHSEQLVSRLLNSSNAEKIKSLFPTEKAAEVQEEVSPRSKKKADAAKAAVNKDKAASTEVLSSELSVGDQFLLQCITDCLWKSSEVNTHGYARFRLDQLLSSYQDALLEFEKTRGSSSSLENTNIIVADELLLNIQTAKPSKPLRWNMPADISLTKALEKTKAKLQTVDLLELTKSNTMGTNNNTNGSFSISLTGNSMIRRLPFYELFRENLTNVTIAMELHRKYHHPTNLPRISQNQDTHEEIIESPTKQKQQQLIETPLQRRLRITPYARMVIVFRYDDNRTLQMINDAISVVNSRALPNIQGTLRSYSFTEAEIEQANTANLDVVCGFSIIDDDLRVVVLEGLGGIGLGMQSIFVDIPREKENDGDLKILSNPEILFPSRLYTEFGPDLKRVRPREKLKKLSKKPEIYNRKQVDEDCFEAIDKILALRRAVDMKSTKDLDLYPTAASINKLELLYGDALSKKDLDGDVATSATQSKKSAVAMSVHAENSSLVTGSVQFEDSVDSPLKKGTRRERKYNSRLDPTDSRNRAFEEYLKTRPPPKDYLQEQRELRRIAWEQGLQRLAEREKADEEIKAKIFSEGRKPVVYCYSGQKLNFREAVAADQRKRLSTIKNATFTYSEQYISQTVPMVDEEADRIELKNAERAKWITQRGFVYPPPKTVKELLIHPKRPNDTRIDDLKEPYEQFESVVVDERQLSLERGFKVSSQASCEAFGMLQPPHFEREFELNLIGDKTKLPRGKMTGGFDKNDQFWQSVHLGGDASFELQQAAAEAEKKAWMDKVVVEHLDFKIGGYNVKDKPSQLERTEDILHDEPHEISLKHLRNRKSTKGRDLSYTTTPVSILNEGEYVSNALEKSLLRSEDKTKFLATTKNKRNEMEPLDFSRYINEKTGKKFSEIFISKKSHGQMNDNEKKGPKWEPIT